MDDKSEKKLAEVTGTREQWDLLLRVCESTIRNNPGRIGPQSTLCRFTEVARERLKGSDKTLTLKSSQATWDFLAEVAIDYERLVYWLCSSRTPIQTAVEADPTVAALAAEIRAREAAEGPADGWGRVLEACKKETAKDTRPTLFD